MDGPLGEITAFRSATTSGGPPQGPCDIKSLPFRYFEIKINFHPLTVGMGWHGIPDTAGFSPSFPFAAD